MHFPTVATALLISAAALAPTATSTAHASTSHPAVAACKGRETRLDDNNESVFFQCLAGTWQRVQCPGRQVAARFAADTVRCVPPGVGRGRRD
ncbi:hypothetical protein [Streptomyces cinnamoneus]|uniref:hypothetical protein n=1 Tax=Streptomyces cinnamoneus TaxID=53446 RepID=UPI0037AB8E6C